MTLDVTVAEAEELLQSRYEAYQHDEGEVRMGKFLSCFLSDHQVDFCWTDSLDLVLCT